MSVPAPHFLLFSNARNDRPPHEPAGQWRFVLEAVDGSSTLEAADDEAEISRDRLELLAIIRGLEALDQPSTVTVVTTSRYVSRGLRFGLPTWRENGWQGEHFGHQVAIKNADLWQRIDHAMQFHRVTCRYYPSQSMASPQLQYRTQVKTELQAVPAVPAAVSSPAVNKRTRSQAWIRGLSNSLDLWTRSISAVWSKPHLRSA